MMRPRRAWSVLVPWMVGLAACGGDQRRPPSMMEPGTCGDGTIDRGETCDSNQSGCATPDGAAGVANCKSDCSGFGECVPNITPACGNATREGGESCDSDSLACTTPEGYPGTQLCNSACTGYDGCTSSLSCGDGICSAGIETTADCPQDCMSGAANDRTRESGVVIRVRSEEQGFLRNNLIDDNPSTAWRDSANVSWIEIDFSGTSAGAYTISDFSFTSASDNPSADPAWWTLIASNGNGQWDTLNNAGASFDQRGERQTFSIANPGSYRVYRFDLGNHGAAFTQVGEIELLESGPAVCGNGTVDGTEVCDSNTRNCTAPSGYPGSERCNPGCDGYQGCTTSLYCGDGACSPGPENSTTCPQDCPLSNYPPPPVYPGTCPTLMPGNNTIDSLNHQRQFELRLPPNPVGAPVVFAWHALNATPQDAMNWPGLDALYGSGGFILVAPYSCCASEWVIGGDPNNNPDLSIFDDVLACLYLQYNVDLDRIYATGFSAGGLYTSYLLQQRSGRLAAAAPFSGGLLGQYTRPQFDLPVMFTWGGPTDMYGSFSFETATLNLSAALRNDGHFVIHCAGNHSHTLPSDSGAWTWRFFQDHPRGIAPEPYAGGLPSALPGYCTIP